MFIFFTYLQYISKKSIESKQYELMVQFKSIHERFSAGISAVFPLIAPNFKEYLVEDWKKHKLAKEKLHSYRIGNKITGLKLKKLPQNLGGNLR